MRLAKIGLVTIFLYSGLRWGYRKLWNTEPWPRVLNIGFVTFDW